MTEGMRFLPTSGESLQTGRQSRRRWPHGRSAPRGPRRIAALQLLDGARPPPHQDEKRPWAVLWPGPRRRATSETPSGRAPAEQVECGRSGGRPAHVSI